MQVRDLFLILALSPVYGCAVKAPASKSEVNQITINPVVPLTECERFKAALPPDWFQETLLTPENPSDPQSPQVKVFYYGKKNSASFPTVFFNGGPSHSSHSAYRRFLSVQKIFDPENKINFIYIDQRGTGCSSPYPKIKKPSDTADVINRTRFYGSENIVADAELIRKKLGFPAWNVFGQSYGAHIAHRYAVQAPEGLRAIFVHGHAVGDEAARHYRERLRAQARVGDLFLRQFPEDREKIARLKKELTPEKCFTGLNFTRRKLCGYEVLVSLELSYLGYADEWALLHRTLGLIVTPGGISAPALSRFVDHYFNYDAENGAELSYPVEGVIAWTDRNSLVLWRPECEKAVQDSVATPYNLNLAPFHECMYRLQNKKANAEISPEREKLIMALPRNPLTLQDLRAALNAHPAQRFYLYSGERDIFAASETARAEFKFLKGLGNVTYTPFNGSGHEGFESEPRLWQDLIHESNLVIQKTNQQGENK